MEHHADEVAAASQMVSILKTKHNEDINVLNGAIEDLKKQHVEQLSQQQFSATSKTTQLNENHQTLLESIKSAHRDEVIQLKRTLSDSNANAITSMREIHADSVAKMKEVRFYLQIQVSPPHSR